MTSDIQTAQQRLAAAALKQPTLNPTSFGVSAYVNGILQSCRIDALVDLYLNPPNETWTRQEALDAALVRALNAKADLLEAEASRIQVAAADRRILAAN